MLPLISSCASICEIWSSSSNTCVAAAAVAVSLRAAAPLPPGPCVLLTRQAAGLPRSLTVPGPSSGTSFNSNSNPVTHTHGRTLLQSLTPRQAADASTLHAVIYLSLCVWRNAIIDTTALKNRLSVRVQWTGSTHLPATDTVSWFKGTATLNPWIKHKHKLTTHAVVTNELSLRISKIHVYQMRINSSNSFTWSIITHARSTESDDKVR